VAGQGSGSNQEPRSIRAGRHVVRVSKPDKVLFPRDGITKGDLAAYYAIVGRAMLPHVRGRPVAMERYPDGLDGPVFYQKDVARQRPPDWVRLIEVSKEGGTLRQVVAENVETLVWLADQACITPHLWLSRVDRPDRPDQLIVDLDPASGGFEEARHAALLLRPILDDLGLTSMVKTTGGRGLHVVVPLDRSEPFEEVRSFARDLAEVLASRDPDRLTTEVRKAKRGDRLYLDIGRNGYAQHAVAPYAVRPRDGAPVATPLDWSEVSDRSLRPERFTMQQVLDRLDRQGDAWARRPRGRSLKAARRKLSGLR
jgi:bifunctional non-homologous end joining protein LigD